MARRKYIYKLLFLRILRGEFMISFGLLSPTSFSFIYLKCKIHFFKRFMILESIISSWVYKWSKQRGRDPTPAPALEETPSVKYWVLECNILADLRPPRCYFTFSLEEKCQEPALSNWAERESHQSRIKSENVMVEKAPCFMRSCFTLRKVFSPRPATNPTEGIQHHNKKQHCNVSLVPCFVIPHSYRSLHIVGN